MKLTPSNLMYKQTVAQKKPSEKKNKLFYGIQSWFFQMW